MLSYSVENCDSNLTSLHNHTTQSSLNLTDTFLHIHTKDGVINSFNSSVPYFISVVNGTIQGTSDIVDVSMVTSINSMTTTVPNVEHDR